MSIITDALRRAERERELKAKRASQESVALIDEPLVVPQTQDLGLSEVPKIEPEVHQIEPERIIPNVPVRAVSNPPVWFLELQFREVLILSGVGVLTFFVLFLLPRWPTLGNNLSLVWRPAQSGNVFQVGAIRKASPFHVDSGGGAVSLPFQLSGVSVSGESRYAIVNGTIVEKGDYIDGAFVKEILDQEVVLETRAGEIKLKT
ncbi:MAG: hypothetical protein HY583_04220 [Candidatus Omnitrophica bacterium]|nr:hypothetical protein [Candidatus Omnitrophota bacterium]